MGHASQRIPGTDRILIKPRHSETMRVPGDLTTERVLEIDLDGNVVAGEEGPVGERFIHTSIYRARPGVGGVVHTHQLYATAFGIAGREILPLLHVEAPLVGGGVPVYPSPELIKTPQLGDAVAQVLGAGPVCHLQGHGIVAVGRDVKEAVVNAVFLERQARANLVVAQLTDAPRVITTDEIERMHGPMVEYPVRWAFYKHLAEHPELPLSW
jgi:ribulose-5-phosphate 4-epimerase/fuculose-1-phosphate aldolase